MTAPNNAVEMTGIKKSFGGIHALKGVDFSVRPGTIHALVGENGAGKSTLLKILQGVQAPSEGRISVFGHEMGDHSAESSRRLGLGMIFQELSLVPTMSVAENIFLNREHKTAGGLLVDRRKDESRARELLAELGLDVDPRAPVNSLSTGAMQMTEIAKALSQDAKVLILDEPTSALSTVEVERLFVFLRGLRARGMAAIYVSHRMDEIMTIADEVTILRDGQNVLSAPMAEISLEAIVENMIGKKVTNFAYVPRNIDRSGTPILSAKGITGRNKPSDCTFDLFRGEVLGIAGLMGSGRSEIARALFGIDRLTGGSIALNGKTAAISSPIDAIKAGIVLIPESRQKEGLVVDHTIAANLSLPQIDALSSGPFVSRSREGAMALDLMGKLRVKAKSASVQVRSLSGGNQQKVVIAKWLATEPDVVILDEPTAGIDIGSKGEIVDLTRSFAAEGHGVIVISSEPAELLALSDRVLIVSNGRIAREVSREEIDAWGGDPNEPGHALRCEHGLQIAIQKANQNVH